MVISLAIALLLNVKPEFLIRLIYTKLLQKIDFKDVMISCIATTVFCREIG